MGIFVGCGRDYINFGAGVSGFGLKGPKPCLNLYRINPQGALFQKAQLPLDSFPFCHDFAMSDRYAIFFLGSIVFGNMLPVVLGAGRREARGGSQKMCSPAAG